MTTRRQSRKIEELTPRTLSEEDSSGDETDPSVPPNSEEERQLLSAENDNEEDKVVTTTIEDEGITTSDEVNNIAATAQAIANSFAGNGTADIRHGLNTMSVSDAVARAITKTSDSSSCSSTLPQDVEMQIIASTQNDETKDDNVSNNTEEREGDDKDSPKAENVETAEPDIAIASGSKDPVVMIKDLTALITTLASKFNGNNPPAAPGREAIKYKEPAPAAKKQEVLNYLKSVPLKDTVLHTQLHHTLQHSEDKFYF